MSREYSPGEHSPIETVSNEVQFHNRTYVGQVQGINTRNGTIDVATSVSGKKERMLIPMPGMSVQGFKSSWIRYMPSVNDFVKVAYGPDNRPVCTGMTMWGNDNKDDNPDQQRYGRTEYHQGGYARVARLAEQRAVGLSEFTELKQGEWDMRSAGGAYIKGTRGGALQLAAGTVRSNLVRERNEVDTRAGLVRWDEGGTSLRLGDVKRTRLPTDFEESEPTLKGKEYLLRVGTQPLPAPAPSLDMYEEHAGDVRDSTGELPLLSPVGAARWRQRVFDSTGLLTSYEKVVDVFGNVREELGDFALTHSVGQPNALVPTCTFGSRYLRSEISTLTTNVIASDLPAAGVFLGSSTAFQPVMLGGTFAAAQLALMTTLGVTHTTYAAFFASIVAWAAAYAIENPPTPTAPSGGLATAVSALGGVTAASAAAATAGTVAMSVATTPAPVGYLSVKVLAE